MPNSENKAIEAIYKAIRTLDLTPLLQLCSSGVKGEPAPLKGTYIYFLFQKNELVYIGRSKNGNRVAKHNLQDYDRWFAIVPGIEGWSLESSLIRRFSPPQNKKKRKF